MHCFTNHGTVECSRSHTVCRWEPKVWSANETKMSFIKIQARVVLWFDSASIANTLLFISHRNWFLLQFPSVSGRCIRTACPFTAQHPDLSVRKLAWSCIRRGGRVSKCVGNPACSGSLSAVIKHIVWSLYLRHSSCRDIWGGTQKQRKHWKANLLVFLLSWMLTLLSDHLCDKPLLRASLSQPGLSFEIASLDSNSSDCSTDAVDNRARSQNGSATSS